MGRMMLGLDNTITFKEDTHQYFDNKNNEYQSVTRILKKLQVPFDRQDRSLMMARGIASSQGISVDQAQANILAEWDGKRDSATNRGNSIHGALEGFLKKGTRNKDYDLAINFVADLVRPSYRYYSETILYDTMTLIAGQTDLVVQRQKTEGSLYDFYDYKTNESKGIEFDSISRKDGIKHYNKMFLSPLSHLEDCNYNLYSLQLSIYAYLAQVTYGIRIGRLGIIFINNEMKPLLIPVNYIKLEVIEILNFMANLNPLPKSKEIVAHKEVLITKDENDW
jgi:hypothetical protein